MAKVKAAVKLDTAGKVAGESKYARAAAKWVASRTREDVDKIYGVDFAKISGGYCDTCGYDTVGMEYYFDDKCKTYESLSYTSVGEFLEECIALM